MCLGNHSFFAPEHFVQFQNNYRIIHACSRRGVFELINRQIGFYAQNAVVLLRVEKIVFFDECVYERFIIGILSSVSAVHVGQIEKFEHRLPSVKYHMSGYVCFSVVRIREITTHLVLGALGFGARQLGEIGRASWRERVYAPV